VLVTSRYPRSYGQADERLALASLTAWQAIGEDAYAGLGQRCWVSDVDEHPLLAARRLERAGDAGEAVAGE